MNRKTITLVPLALLALAAPRTALAQSFQPGQLYHVSPALSGVGYSSGIASLGTNASTFGPFYEKPAGGIEGLGPVYCPARDRILVTSSATIDIVDAGGGSTSVGPAPQFFQRMAARGDGLVYLLSTSSSPKEIQILLPDNTFAVLGDGTGSNFVHPIAQIACGWYDAPTNTLITAHLGALTSITSIPLSADGLSVAGAPTIVTKDVSPGSADSPHQFSFGPGASVMLKVDDNTNAAVPRFQLLDPVTLSLTDFASSMYTGAAGESGGVYVPALNAAVTLDTLNDVYRAYGPGSSGAGLVLGAASSTVGCCESTSILLIPEVTRCVADVNTTNTNPGDAAYGQPDGSVDGADLSYFVENWLAANASVADVNTTNTNPGDAAYGQPDGSVDGADLSFFVEAWLAGCP